ncbi:QueT transporter family protein [Staphylococcus hyicus]|uniref:QueT transporter family protein n=1 Tax=Staphylococcus hyicus TaxID=1284 RepID=UPI00273980BA|nr:QueT transporter family protein [Staphylococcus hyicus]MDP4448503.1 QueT transporter family protein [Staphylococcus hyicus]
MTTKFMTQISAIAALLTVFALFKLPALLPGLEFQLSAPVSLLILAFFGIKRYFIGGLISSMILFIIGVFNPLHLCVSIIFRLVAIGVVYGLGVSLRTLCLAGCVGTLVSRVILATFLHLPPIVLVAHALPGICFTLIVVSLLYPTLSRRPVIQALCK